MYLVICKQPRRQSRDGKVVAGSSKCLKTQKDCQKGAQGYSHSPWFIRDPKPYDRVLRGSHGRASGTVSNESGDSTQVTEERQVSKSTDHYPLALMGFAATASSGLSAIALQDQPSGSMTQPPLFPSQAQEQAQDFIAQGRHQTKLIRNLH